MTTRMAQLRRNYTGETLSAVLPAIRDYLVDLTADDRTHLLETLKGRTTDPLPQHLRSTLIPAASSPAQLHLEASVLDALSRAAITQPQVVWMVRPRTNEIALHPHHEALAALLRELLPREADDGLHGIAGLRARVHRRHVELYLLDSVPTATVLLPAVSYRRWSTALDKFEPATNLLRWMGNDPTPLRPVELELTHPKPHAAAASAILRRIGLFPTPPEVTTSADHPGVLALDWHDGPSTARVALDLLDDIAGLPATAACVHPGGTTHLSLNAAGARLLLRGPDLGTADDTSKEPPVPSDQTFTASAAQYCPDPEGQNLPKAEPSVRAATCTREPASQ
ncbi:hypothetical protein [Kutzneria albida]|uniref:hypothetical protein n=1 Tax=Kutzneria albida TaxID=43357 RepID=UPI0011DC737F|nr:hypothetical protein [Kutzneria albida]